MFDVGVKGVDVETVGEGATVWWQDVARELEEIHRALITTPLPVGSEA